MSEKAGAISSPEGCAPKTGWLQARAVRHRLPAAPSNQVAEVKDLCQVDPTQLFLLLLCPFDIGIRASLFLFL